MKKDCGVDVRWVVVLLSDKIQISLNNSLVADRSLFILFFPSLTSENKKRSGSRPPRYQDLLADLPLASKPHRASITT